MKPDSHQLACRHCGAVNRFPADRSNDDPDCGRCHRELFDGQPVASDDTSFDTMVNATTLPVVVDFWADWCGPCRTMAPRLLAGRRRQLTSPLPPPSIPDQSSPWWRAATQESLKMPKGQQRSNKESKKPRKDTGAPKPVSPVSMTPTAVTVVPDRSKKKK